jgi:hypothetical protein
MRTPMVKASGSWTWTTKEPQALDLLVANIWAGEVESSDPGTAARLLRVEFTGTLVRHLELPDPPVQVRGAILSGPRQAQALVASLHKLVSSALGAQRSSSDAATSTSTERSGNPAFACDRWLDSAGDRSGVCEELCCSHAVRPPASRRSSTSTALGAGRWGR